MQGRFSSRHSKFSRVAPEKTNLVINYLGKVKVTFRSPVYVDHFLDLPHEGLWGLLHLCLVPGGGGAALPKVVAVRGRRRQRRAAAAAAATTHAGAAGLKSDRIRTLQQTFFLHRLPY